MQKRSSALYFILISHSFLRVIFPTLQENFSVPGPAYASAQTHGGEQSSQHGREMPWKDSPSGVVETGWSEKLKCKRKCKGSKKNLEDSTRRSCMRLRGSNNRWDIRIVPLYSFASGLWFLSRLQPFWIRNCLKYYFCTMHWASQHSSDTNNHSTEAGIYLARL